jgi:glycosyltransferase involved in cell wall biosynthesis
MENANFIKDYRMKKRVLLRAPLLTISGYGVHSRQIFEYLYNKDEFDITVELLNWGQTSWMINPNLEDGLIMKIMSKSKQVQGVYDLTIQVQLPDEWNPKLGHKNIGISAFVETNKINPEWIDKCNLMDEIIVPSTFIKDTIDKTKKCSTTITVVPELYNQEVLNNHRQLVANKLHFDTSFNFLLFGQLTGQDPWTDRKNIYFTIKWFCETFKDNKDVGLVVKTNMGKSTIIDRKLTFNTLSTIIKEVRQGDYPRIHLVHGNMNSKEVAGIYQQESIKCLITATRGEGYGLPIIDAAASGMPVIATGWSGHLDFLDKKYSTLLHYELKAVANNKIDNRIFVKGSKWAEVDEDHFKLKLLECYEKIDSKKRNANKLKKKVINKFAPTRVYKQYDNVIKRAIL